MTEERKIKILKNHGMNVVNIDGLDYVEDAYTDGFDLVLVESIENIAEFLNY